MKRTTISLVAFASMFVVGAVPNAQARQCSNASLKGAYGFFTGAFVVPTPRGATGTPRGNIGRWNFDGLGHFTNTLTVNDNGTIIHVTDSGTYTVAPDCTGTIFVSNGTLAIVLVDGGNEFYQLRTAPESIVLIFSVAKKQFPGDNEQD